MLATLQSSLKRYVLEYVCGDAAALCDTKRTITKLLHVWPLITVCDDVKHDTDHTDTWRVRPVLHSNVARSLLLSIFDIISNELATRFYTMQSESESVSFFPPPDASEEELDALLVKQQQHKKENLKLSLEKLVPHTCTHMHMQ